MKKKPARSDLGSVSCNLPASIVAGSYQSCVLTYTAGFAGIDDTGSLKLVMRYATDAGTPQFEEPKAPNFTTAVASNGARLFLRYDLKDNVRPWGKTLYIKVLQGYLREGDRIVVTLGDQTHGSPGWRMQTFVEDSFELRVLVDRYATYVYEQLPNAPTFRIIPGEPVKLVAVAPSVVGLGEEIVVRSKLEDAWGNPVASPRKDVYPASDQPVQFVYHVVDDATSLGSFTNPIIARSGDKYGRFWADLHGQSEETIGTNTIEQYFQFARDYGFLDACAHQGNDFQITDTFWKQIQETTQRFYEPGKFVTFPGWEWSGNTGLGGDRNVLYLKEGGPISRSSRALVAEEDAEEPCSNTLEDLFARLKKYDGDAMLVPHVGGRYADLERHDPRLEPVVEVHSAWGTFEWMLEDAFRLGYRIGIVANSDGHKGRPGASSPGASTFGSYGGLTCILAERLDRESIWEAYKARRVYATTGARIHLDVTADGEIPIGAVLPVTADAIPEFSVLVHGTAPLDRVEFRNGMRVLKTLRPYTAKDLYGRVKILWQGAEVRGRGRQVDWDGGLRVIGNHIRSFETVNFLNLEKKCEQISKTELRWQSSTTGGVAGVIVDLEKPGTGKLAITTLQKEAVVSLDGMGLKGKSFQLGGVGKKLSVYRLPLPGSGARVEFRFRPKVEDLHPCDNPLYICAVQVDGHMAWSSPIYLVLPGNGSSHVPR